jgi:O-antigen/teichoic acid export membrane protein
MKGLFWVSAPLGITLLFNLVYFRVDSIILTLTRTTAEVGVYGLAYKIFELPLVIPTFFMNALYPVMLEHTVHGTRYTESEYISVLKKSAGLLFAGSLIVIGALWIGAPIISFIRTDFVGGTQVLRVLALGLPFFFLSSLTMWTLIAKKKQTLLAVIYFISMIVNVLLNMIFIPRFGYMAAAWITVGSEGFVLAMSGYSAVHLMGKRGE